MASDRFKMTVAFSVFLMAWAPVAPVAAQTASTEV